MPCPELQNQVSDCTEETTDSGRCLSHFGPSDSPAQAFQTDGLGRASSSGLRNRHANLSQLSRRTQSGRGPIRIQRCQKDSDPSGNFRQTARHLPIPTFSSNEFWLKSQTHTPKPAHPKRVRQGSLLCPKNRFNQVRYPNARSRYLAAEDF